MIEAISVNLSQIEKISELDCSVFERFDCLRFLEFHQHAYEESKVRFCWEGFGGFSEELRYFRWDAYPCKSLPSIFCAENLIEFHMPRTTIKELWTGKQNIVNLKIINLGGANKLVEFTDVSEGRNIQGIYLNYCKSLVKLPPSIQHLPKLKILDLEFSLSVESVPTTFDSKVLEDFNLSYCGGVKMFPRLASANIITKLNLNETCIREVPSTVELLKGLKFMSMSGCEKLSIISTNICKLKSLSELMLWGCTNLESFPEIMEPMESLTSLELGGCTRLKRLPNDHSFHNLKSLEELHLDDTAITELPSSIQHLICLKKLKISGCQNLTSLPSFIHNQRMLELDLEGCSNLCSLPELPSSLETLRANGCVSLKTISSACFSSESRTRSLNFASCFELDEEERRRVLDIAFSIHQYNSSPLGMNKFRTDFEIVLPWSEIPQWFCGSQSVGSSLTLKLPMDDQCYTLAFGVVVKPNYANSYYCSVMDCYVDDEYHIATCEFVHLFSDIEHLLLWYHGDNALRKYGGREVSFQFREKEGNVEVTKCGVLILPVEDTGNAESYS